MKTFVCNIHLTERLLASSPANPEVYAQYIAARKRGELPQDEIDTLPAGEQEKVGWSVFHSDTTGLFLFEYHLKGFLKEAGRTITGKAVSALISKIDRFIFVSPRRLYLMRNGTEIKSASGNLISAHGCMDYFPILKPDGVEERPIRAMTMQGPRVSLKRSDYVDNARFACEIMVLDEKQFSAKTIREGETEHAIAIPMFKLLSSWLDYGKLMGLGEWRTGGYGRFAYELKEK